MEEYFWGAFFVIAIIALSVAGAAGVLKYNDGLKECTENSDCPSLSYCGSDFECHTFPNISQNVESADWTTPAIILGLAIILAALILKAKS